jgi:hypothetical protein
VLCEPDSADLEACWRLDAGGDARDTRATEPAVRLLMSILTSLVDAGEYVEDCGGN